jgi:Putative peptidoglycan binding domain
VDLGLLATVPLALRQLSPDAMFSLFLLSISALTVVGGAMLYLVAGHPRSTADAAPPPENAYARPEELSARYREQMRLAQETLRHLGYTPGPPGGTIGVETRSALRAFQHQQRLRVTGRANPETLAALGIDDRMSRRPQ